MIKSSYSRNKFCHPYIWQRDFPMFKRQRVAKCTIDQFFSKNSSAIKEKEFYINFFLQKEHLSFNRSTNKFRYLSSFKYHYIEASKKVQEQENQEIQRLTLNKYTCRDQTNAITSSTLTCHKPDLESDDGWSETVLEASHTGHARQNNGNNGIGRSRTRIRSRNFQLTEKLLLDIQRENDDLLRRIQQLQLLDKENSADEN
eukprot:Awhi_evm1s2478